MNLSSGIIHDLNTLADWLSPDELAASESISPDLLILAGHAILPNITGAMRFIAETGIPVLFSGGIGHSTALLRQAVKNNPLTTAIETEDKSEAEILADIAERIFRIPKNKIFVESQSTNCGQNADFSSELILQHNLAPSTIILVQDPLMQRRTYESFAFSWKKKNMAGRFINWPVFKPHLIMASNQPIITGAQFYGVWALNRYISMILGEVKRLRDDVSGYGPLGAGFIGHVDIPEEIECAWQRLIGDSKLVEIVR
ncbi:MAG: YdcF family protein [Gibbsiella quercinecans]|uniref:YdcF family protein n=1 Tax=Gibbsiella quercinecans TaxID=929813 RepID=UPI003F2BAB1C